MRIWSQKSASIQKRTSPLKFDVFAEKSEKDTVSYLSTKVYAACLYWATYTITGIGYGEYRAKNEYEFATCTVLMLGSAFTWAVVVANVVSIIAGMNQEEADH